MSDDEIQVLLRGPVGNSVQMTIGHSPAFTPIKIEIPFTEISIPSTTWNLLPDFPQTGIVYIKVIAETTPAEVTQAIHDLQSQGASQILLDVRNNGGGLVESGVDLARLFLKEGAVIQEQYRGEPIKTYSVDRPGPFVDLPVAILVNHGTASAAEIFAGALQGQNRAVLVGSATYGKNSIQLVFTLKDGSSLHVTAAHWWIPSLNQDMNSKGLQPDFPISDKEMDTKGIQAAVESLSQK
jgi:carboxyl-terminal processing protease